MNPLEQLAREFEPILWAALDSRYVVDMPEMRGLVRAEYPDDANWFAEPISEYLEVRDRTLENPTTENELKYMDLTRTFGLSGEEIKAFIRKAKGYAKEK